MTPSTTPTKRPPTTAAVEIVHLAVHRLPRGDVRERYEQEFTAELYGMTRARQLRTALGILATSGALRHALHTSMPTTTETAMTLTRSAKPWTCRLNLYHRWERRSTEDGELYQACARCDRMRPPRGAVPPIG